MRKMIQFKNRIGRAALGLTLGLSLGALSACDTLLEVDLPHLLTDAALESEDTAETQVNSAIALYECGWSAFSWGTPGSEGVLEAIAGLGATAAVFRDTSATGGCDFDAISQAWFDQIMGARAMLSRVDERGVYDRIQGEWDLGAEGERLSAISSIYMAASLGHFGTFLCDFSIDGSANIAPPQVIDMADAWVTTALSHMPVDFVMPFGIASSARNMAIALRAQILWARGDATATGHNDPVALAAAAAAATTVLTFDPAFMAYVTREAGETRRNKVHSTLQTTVIATIYDRIDWWNPEIRSPNPATGLRWTNPIIFTGYVDLAIMPDGRTVSDAGDPITTATAGAVADTRVRTYQGPGTGPGVFTIPIKYSSDTDDQPIVTWKELRLIQAENANVLGDRTGAIAFLNIVRDGTGFPVAGVLPSITYLNAGSSFQQVRYAIHEERRRALFLEGGRYLAAAIQNTDISWFPRMEGNTPGNASYILQGGVRYLFPQDEYTLNPNFLNLDQRGDGCVAHQAPIVG